MVQRQLRDPEAVLGSEAEDRQAACHDVVAKVVGDRELSDGDLDADLGKDTTLKATSVDRRYIIAAVADPAELFPRYKYTPACGTFLLQQSAS